MSSSSSSGSIDSITSICLIPLGIQYPTDYDFSHIPPGFRRSGRFAHSTAETSSDSASSDSSSAFSGDVEILGTTSRGPGVRLGIKKSQRVALIARAPEKATQGAGTSRGLASRAGTSKEVAPKARVSPGAGASKGITPGAEISGTSSSRREVASGAGAPSISPNSVTSKTSSKRKSPL